jgi:predicted  nucleic acid-binding Zn-ribbon protein
MDEDAVERASKRIEQAVAGRPSPGDVDAALERAREQIEALAQAAAELEATLPDKVGDAVKEGVRAQAQPLGRQVAEMRGLLNRLVRKLERLEGDLLAERNARVDDLALLVDLISSGWRGVDERLARLEKALTDKSGAVVYRIEERRSS